MQEEESLQTLELIDVDELLQNSLRPFTDSRLGNSLRFQLQRNEDENRVSYSVSARIYGKSVSDLPSLQIIARATPNGIAAQYEVRPQGVVDEQLLSGKYALAYLKSLVKDASQFYFMALSSYSDQSETVQEPVETGETKSDEDVEVEIQDDRVAAPPKSQESLGELDLFDYDELGDKTVEAEANVEPLAIEL